MVLRQLEIELEKIIDPSVDSLRFYRLGNNHDTKVKHIGAKQALEIDKPLIF